MTDKTFRKSTNVDKFLLGDSRTIIGVASHIGYPADRDGDIMGKDAFLRSIANMQNGGKIKLLDGHMHGTTNTLGVVKRLWMDGDKLMFEAKLSEAATAEDTYQKLKEGVLDQVSIGFQALDVDIMDEGGFLFKDIEIFEISVVPIPANPNANILMVKNKDLPQNNNKEQEPPKNSDIETGNTQQLPNAEGEVPSTNKQDNVMGWPPGTLYNLHKLKTRLFKRSNTNE